LDESKPDSNNNDDENKSIETIAEETLSDTDKAIIEDAKNALVNAIETIKNFAQSMVTLVSGLFAAYFALLKFVGIEDITSSKVIPIENLILLPPIFFILSLIMFVLAVLPVPGKLSLSLLSDMRESRRLILKRKYIFAIIGLILLVVALSVSAGILLQPIYGDNLQSQT
jgi:hypothetical protein